jgi:hypothetical protein
MIVNAPSMFRATLFIYYLFIAREFSADVTPFKYLFILPVRENVFSKDENRRKQNTLIVKQLNSYNIWILAPIR